MEDDIVEFGCSGVYKHSIIIDDLNRRANWLVTRLFFCWLAVGALIVSNNSIVRERLTFPRYLVPCPYNLTRLIW